VRRFPLSLLSLLCTHSHPLPPKMATPPSPPLPSKFTSKLHNASILILGGTSGVGYAVAEACIEFRCARLTISGSRQPKIDATIARLRATYPSSTYLTHISGHACDLSDLTTLETNLSSLLDFATSSSSEESHKLNHIVNTAGDIFSLPPLHQVTPDQIHKSSIVRFYGSMMLGKLLASPPGSSSRYIEMSPSSSVTLTGGGAATKPPPGWSTVAPFAAAKEGLARSLAVDLKPVR
jgi:NAD(P)-dependent dehydrogenase (short-subunit alcohol dehydrogenase family)